MALAFTPVTLDSTINTVAGNTGRYARFHSSASWLAFSGDSGLTLVARDAANDDYPTKQGATGLGAAAYDAPVFYEAVTPDRLIFGSSSNLYWLDDTGTAYTYTSPNTVTGTGMGTVDTDISPDGAHLADAGNGTIYVWGLDEGSSPGVSPPQEYNWGGGFWTGCRYSPDGVHLAATQNGAGLRIFRRDGDTYTHLSGAPVPVGSSSYYDGFISWSEDGQLVAVGGSGPGAVGVRVLQRSGDTFTLDPTTYGNNVPCFPIFVGGALVCLSRTDNQHKVYQRTGTVLTADDAPNLTGIPAVNYADRAKDRPDLLALAHGSAPHYAVYRVEDAAPQPVDGEGEMVMQRMVTLGSAYNGDPAPETVTQMSLFARPAVAMVSADPASLTQENLGYIEARGVSTMRRMRNVDSWVVQGWAVMPSETVMPAMRSEGEIAVPITVEGETSMPRMEMPGVADLAAFDFSGLSIMPAMTSEAEGTVRYLIEGEMSMPRMGLTGGAGWPQTAEGEMIMRAMRSEGLATLPMIFSGDSIMPRMLMDGDGEVGRRSFYGTSAMPRMASDGLVGTPYLFEGVSIIPRMTTEGGAEQGFDLTGTMFMPRMQSTGEFVQPVFSGTMTMPRMYTLGEIRPTILADSVSVMPRMQMIASGKSSVYAEGEMLLRRMRNLNSTYRAYYAFSGTMTMRRMRTISSGGISDAPASPPSFRLEQDPFELGGGVRLIFGNFTIG